MNKKILISAKAVALMLLMMTHGHVQAQLAIGTELRPRAEFRNGYKQLATRNHTTGAFVSQRTRINASFENERFKTYVSFQNVSTWGDQRTNAGTAISSDSSLTTLHEAWGELQLGRYATLRMGRQSLFIEDHRLLTTADWNQGAKALDGLLFQYANDSVMHLRLFASFNAEREEVFNTGFPSSKMKTFNFIHLKRDFGKGASLALVDIVSGYQQADHPDHIAMLNTVGGYLTLHPHEALSVGGSAFLQTGHNKTDKKTNAYLANAFVTYRMGALEATAALDVLSGNDATNSDAAYRAENHAFDMLLGSGHLHNGLIDQWSGNYAVNKSAQGLINPQLKTSYKLKQHTIKASYHYLMAQADVVNPADQTEMDKFLAHEVDIIWNWKMAPDLWFDMGYSWLTPSHTFKIQKGTPDALDHQHWAWAQLTFKPKLFDGAKTLAKHN
ncbi:MAG: alginate export family protein [Marinilabiliaceae bacterium]|nr:alginate export family protein [Marinilabiliaceae bacterium]